MKKSNFFKSLACGLMMTMVVGTSVFAGTATETKRVRNSNYNQPFKGALGNYAAAGDDVYAITSVQNTTTSTCYYSLTVCYYSYGMQKFVDTKNIAPVLHPGDVSSIKTSRQRTSYIKDYYHYAKGSVSSSFSTGTMLDNYTFIAEQYYE